MARYAQEVPKKHMGRVSKPRSSAKRCQEDEKENGAPTTGSSPLFLKDISNIASHPSPHSIILRPTRSDSGHSSSADENSHSTTLCSPNKQLQIGTLLQDEARNGLEWLDEAECPEKILQVHGRFAKLNVEFGRGSFKTVYKGQDMENGSTIAWCESRISKKDHKRFKIEADLLKRLQHPSIIRFYDYWEVVERQTREKYFVLITEFMTSGTLRSYLKNFSSKVPMRVIKSWCRKILKGLAYLHSRNPAVIHRDLKCDNIFVSGSSGAVKIGDLGLAVIADRKGEARSVIGTPEFMAPEIFDEQYDESVDVYAFGMCMVEMVTQQYPYAECDNAAQIYRKITGGVRPLGYGRIEDVATKAVVDRCIRFSKTERYTVKELLALEYFLDELDVRVELVDRDRAISYEGSTVSVLVRYPEKLASKCKIGDSRAVQISLNVLTDDPEVIVSDMVKRSLMPDCDNVPTNVVRQLRERMAEVRKEQSWHQLSRLQSRAVSSPLEKSSTDVSDAGTQLNKASNSSPPSSQGSSRPVRPASDLLDLDEKLSNITNFSVMRHESVSFKPGEAPRLHVRKVSDPGLYSSSELASLDSAAERADTSRTLTAEVQTGRFRVAPTAMIGEAKENITDF
ncbi:hypothetical protein RvY_01114 [Ramazzottius varieornatus]|uniref:Protein kinase domain-containing protein n=1 Tax=Ramazzottius varieornatus TaxID=947166 RepID=A0A1D1UFJ0_RAMVA|nr:hypothetical protein RvY_01114 [Ramazzottius varieornatus]